MRTSHKLLTLFANSAIADSYAAKINTMFGANLVAFWKLNETTGSAANDSSATGAVGAYGAAVTLAQAAGPGAGMGKAPTFPGSSNGNVTFVAGSLTKITNVWNVDEATISIWIKMDTVAHWNDANIYYPFAISADGNNQYRFFKVSANSMRFQSTRGGSAVNRTKGSITDVGWVNLTGVISVSLNVLRFYWNGVQEGADQALTGTWSGALGAATGIGSFGAGNYWNGNLEYALIAKRAASAAEVAQIAVAS